MHHVTTKPFIATPDLTNSRFYGPNLMSHIVSSAATDGQVGIIQFYGQTGGEPPVHIHSHEDEFFFILDGEATFLCGGKEMPVKAGSFVWLPRGMAHGFTFHSGTGRGLVGFTPGDFEEWFIGFSFPAPAMELPIPQMASYEVDMDAMVGTSADLGVLFVDPDQLQVAPPADAESLPFVAHRDSADVLDMPTMSLRFLANSEDTAERVICFELDLMEGACVPVHAKNVFKMTYILEGKARVQLGDELHEVGPETIIGIPAGTAYGYRSLSGTLRTLEIVMGGDFDDFAAELHVLCNSPEASWENVSRLMLEYGIQPIAPEVA